MSIRCAITILHSCILSDDVPVEKVTCPRHCICGSSENKWKGNCIGTQYCELEKEAFGGKTQIPPTLLPVDCEI
jgi:hypothetical protein